MKSLFFGASFLLLVPNQVSAVLYGTDHQQYYDLVDESEYIISSALTPVEEDEWAFAGTLKYDPNIKDRGLQPNSNSWHWSDNGILVKLNPGSPLAPFTVEWSKNYTADGDYSLAFNDVYYENSAYILCGSVKSEDGTQQGFMMRATVSGDFAVGKVYPEIYEFNSVVPWIDGSSLGERGYIAVGRTQEDEDHGYEAAYMSVNFDLVPQCASRMSGRFASNILGSVKSTFNKVIQYTYKDEKLYAAVGDTDKRYNLEDVLVTVADKDCDVSYVRQYGMVEGFRQRAYSVAKTGEKGGLTITGNSKRQSYMRKSFNDVLIFQVNHDGDSIEMMNRYDIDPGNSVIYSGGNDFGAAVQTTADRIVVAGQTGQINDDGSRVTFLLQVSNDEHGNVLKKTNLFLEDMFNGALGGKLDLHESDDGWLIMGNKGNAITGLGKLNNPYLVERYAATYDPCNERLSTPSKSLESLSISDFLESWSLEVNAEDIYLLAENMDTVQSIECPKYIVPEDDPDWTPGSP